MLTVCYVESVAYREGGREEGGREGGTYLEAQGMKLVLV